MTGPPIPEIARLANPREPPSFLRPQFPSQDRLTFSPNASHLLLKSTLGLAIFGAASQAAKKTSC